MLHILFNDWEEQRLALKQFQSKCTKLELSSDFLFYRVDPVFSIAGAQHITFQGHFLQIHSGFSHTLSEWRLSWTPTSAASHHGQAERTFRVHNLMPHEGVQAIFFILNKKCTISNTKKITWQIPKYAQKKMQSLEMCSSLILTSIGLNPTLLIALAHTT